MADLRAFEQIDAGGVDSRSNPINMPRNRALRCLNWVPRQAGFWEQRWGYSTVTMSVVVNSPIHTMLPFRLWNGSKYVLFMQGTTWKLLNTATGTVTTPTVKGASIVSSSKGSSFVANNRIHYGNGTDQKFFDGTYWRDSGLPTFDSLSVTPNPALTDAQVIEGVRELTPTEASTITLTVGGGGTFPGDSSTGRLIYVAFFDTTHGELGPSTLFSSSGRIVIPLNDKVTVANMPNVSSAHSSWIKLFAGTDDGQAQAYFFTTTSTNIVSCTVNSGVLTVVATGHGLISSDIIVIGGTGQFDGVYTASVSDANTFTVTLDPFNHGTNTGAVGTVGKCVKATAAATSQDITADTRNKGYMANQDRGLAASTVGTSTPGYQFFVAIYNPTTGHMGNRTQIGGRALQTAYRSNWIISGIHSFVGQDSEWQIVFGRTGDGELVPYICADNAVNWQYVPLASAGGTISAPSIDGAHELPTRNGIIPSQCNMFCVAGDYAYAADTGSPTLRRSGSFLDDRAGLFTGRPEQSWAPNDIDTFPTGEAMTGIFEVDSEVLCGTLTDCAISVNLAGIQQWAAGPWPIGIAGFRAGTKCGSHGFFWISGDKQLCTMEQGVPVVVAEEYQAAELSQIGDSYLSTVECSYFRDAQKDKDELRISFQLQNGTPYTVIHDFKLMDARSVYGQAYAAQFLGPLASVYTIAQVRDGNSRLQTYCGASNGQIFVLYSGANDAGTEFNSDLIMLVNGGTQRPSVPFIDWYGDGKIDVSIGKTLQTSLAAGAQFSFEQLTPSDNPAQAVQGAENDFIFRAYQTTPEVQHNYIRFQLTSHSADGTLALNSPPHLPLENYGRIYELIPAIGDERDR